MNRNDCKYFDDCSAPLCPKYQDGLNFCAWFPDEEICKLKSIPDWVRKQKKIAKKINPEICELAYFTYPMLKQNCVFTANGISPEKDRETEEKKWLKKHPEKRKISTEEQEIIKQRFKKNVLSYRE